MCNVNCFKWGVKNLTKEEVFKKRVIEVGSYDVNGTLRYIIELMEPYQYVGSDIIEGPGVDLVCPAENLVETFGKENFDLVISTCALEHMKDWQKAISNIKNVCKPNGIIIIIVPSNWPFHEYPYDFWRYEKEDIKNIFSDCDILLMEEDPRPLNIFSKITPALVYAKMRKPESFFENNLSDYQLYSVISNKKASQISDEDFHTLHFRWLILKSKVNEILVDLVNIVFRKF